MPNEQIQSLTYADLHPAKTCYAPRTTRENIRWILSSHFQIDSVTGITSCLMGDMPLICHRAVVTPPALEFMRLAGLSPPKKLLTYSTEAEAVSLAKQRIDLGERLAYIFPPLHGEDIAAGLLVPATVYGRLNDKIRIPEFVGYEYLPKRQVIQKENIGELLDQSPGYPVFVKAGVEGASGGGHDVRYCDSEASWRKAIQWFQNKQDEVSGLVIEEAIDVQTCWCLGVSILDTGCLYLGAAIQLFDKPPTQTGSRIDPDFSVPDEAGQITLKIAEEARQQGYRGIAGFDIGIDANKNLFVFDLNFRLNSCTNQLLLHGHATRSIGARVSQSWSVSHASSIAGLLERLVPFAEKGVFIPFRMFDQQTFNDIYPEREAESVISGMIVADSVSEIELLDATMRQALT